jgi:hypothetical protein
MPSVSFGQPVGGVVQVAYIVRDIEQSMKDFTSRLNVGPWFVAGPLIVTDGHYRGQPTSLELTLAIGFAGHMMVELIQQHNDVPSVYKEIVSKRGYGFHHFAIASPDFERDVERYKSMGYEVAFSAHSPRGTRVAYMDTTNDLGGMLEIGKFRPESEALFAKWYEASMDWDGSNPVRRL